MSIAVIQFPGADSGQEIMLAIERAGMSASEFLWNDPPEKLADFAGFVILGQCSDAAFDSVMSIVEQQGQLGKPILGIGLGAQVLVETGLVPGLEGNQVGMKLVLGTRYDDVHVAMRLSKGYQWNAFTRCVTPKQILQVPTAYPDSYFVISPVLLAELKRNGLCVFQYDDEEEAIAAVSNKAGNVIAMVPNLALGGDVIFNSMREYIADGCMARPAELSYQPRPPIRVL